MRILRRFDGHVVLAHVLDLVLRCGFLPWVRDAVLEVPEQTRGAERHLVDDERATSGDAVQAGAVRHVHPGRAHAAVRLARVGLLHASGADHLIDHR